MTFSRLEAYIYCVNKNSVLRQHRKYIQTYLLLALGGNVVKIAAGSVVFENQAKFSTSFKEAYQLGMEATPVTGNITLNASVDGARITTNGEY